MIVVCFFYESWVGFRSANITSKLIDKFRSDWQLTDLPGDSTAGNSCSLLCSTVWRQASSNSNCIRDADPFAELLFSLLAQPLSKQCRYRVIWTVRCPHWWKSTEINPTVKTSNYPPFSVCRWNWNSWKVFVVRWLLLGENKSVNYRSLFFYSANLVNCTRLDTFIHFIVLKCRTYAGFSPSSATK